jgi:hypothetical protein
MRLANASRRPHARRVQKNVCSESQIAGWPLVRVAMGCSEPAMVALATLAVGALVACTDGTLPSPGIRDPRNPSAANAPTLASAPPPSSSGSDVPPPVGVPQHSHDHSDATAP